MKHTHLLLAMLALVLLMPAEALAQKSKRKKKKEETAKPPPASADKWGVESSNVFAKGFTGFVLFDPKSGETLYDYNGGKYFTPASNVKILTLYASLRTLGDSIPALQYARQGDLMVFWGTGDPSFLNPYLPQNPAVFDFLKSRREPLFFCPGNFKDERFGSGWMWGDYVDNYQAEKSPFPIYGNLATFSRDSTDADINVRPSIFKEGMRFDTKLPDDYPIGRDEWENHFTFNQAVAKGKAFKFESPFRCSPELLVQMLSDTLRRPVFLLDAPLTPPANAKTLYSIGADSLYTDMMQVSDNFIAEQLLQLCSWRKYGTMNTERIIEDLEKSLFTDSDKSGQPPLDDPKWVDGSGLSRYNLLTPRFMVRVLQKIYEAVPDEERLLGIFPAGGLNGTIQNNYKNGDKPYVFAKTGTLRHQHCLSGYLRTKKGKLLIFSFMHGNYTGSMNGLKREMEEVLRRVYEEG